MTTLAGWKAGRSALMLVLLWPLLALPQARELAPNHGLAPRAPLTFEQAHSHLRAGVLECDRSRFALRTVVQARNQRHEGQDWLALQLSGTTGSDTLLGPLERPATPEQLRSLVGQERCSQP